MHDDNPTTAPAPHQDASSPNAPDADRRKQAQRLADDAIAVSDRILSETARLLELDIAAHSEADRTINPRYAKPRILLTNLTRQVERERAGAVRYLEQFLDPATDPIERDLAFTRLSCFNITFHDTLWSVVKRRCGLVSVLREIEVPTSHGPTRKDLNAGRGGGPKRNLAKVDAVVENGAEWMKIITADARRLLFQMTNAGWDWEVEEGEMGIDISDGESTGIEAIDMVRDLVAAAAVSRVSTYHYQTPRVRVHFAKIREGESPHIDALLQIIRSLGDKDNVTLAVEFGGDNTTVPLNNGDEPALDDALQRLIPREDFFFTDVLNLDCTILFNIGSDTAHFQPDNFLSRQEARIKEDLEDERRNGPRLPRDVYPMLRGRIIVCTELVAENFRNTVMDIGTETEIARARLLLPPSDVSVPTPPATEEERLKTLRKFQELSVHPVPEDLRLPIQVVKTPDSGEVAALVAEGVLPEVLLKLDDRIKPMNASGMLYGWAHGQTTLTSNRQGMNLLNQIIAESGPEAARAKNVLHVWMAPFGRRLAAKPRPSDADGTAESPPEQ